MPNKQKSSRSHFIFRRQGVAYQLSYRVRAGLNSGWRMDESHADNFTNDLKTAEAIRLTIPAPSSASPMSSSSETIKSHPL
jgi:hypothetical protein